MTAKGKRKRPTVLQGKTIIAKVGCGELRITFNEKRGKTNEIRIKDSFARKDGAAHCGESFHESLGRTITFCIRRCKKGEEPNIYKQLIDHECDRRSVATRKSCCDAIGRVMKCHYEGHKVKEGRCYICGGVYEG